MSHAQLELVNLPNGDFVLRNSQDGNVFVKIEFTPALRNSLREKSISTKEMANVMIQAGLGVINQNAADEKHKISSKETLLH